jgi:hypothetical protein
MNCSADAFCQCHASELHPARNSELRRAEVGCNRLGANAHTPCPEGAGGRRARQHGLTVSDAVRILLTRIANEGAVAIPDGHRPDRLRRLVPGEGTSGPGGSPSGNPTRRRRGALRQAARRSTSPAGQEGLVRLEWSAWAQADRNAIFDYIDNPRAAAAVDKRISDRVNMLKRFPRSGRPGSRYRHTGVGHHTYAIWH